MSGWRGAMPNRYFTAADEEEYRAMLGRVTRAEYQDKRRRLDKALADWGSLSWFKQILWTILST